MATDPNAQISSESNIFIGNSHVRPRRMRRSAAIRSMVNETHLGIEHLIAPIFVTELDDERTPIRSMLGVERLPLKYLAEEIKSLWSLGIQSVILFPVVRHKDLLGTESYNPKGLIQEAIRMVKLTVPEMVVFADVALDPFTSHGHDGILNARGEIDNDSTVGALCRMSVTLANAGVDFVAPSDMMDGRIGAIRQMLDSVGHTDTGILAYSAKYASAFYGPFREAIGSGTRGLDKKTYQMSTGQKTEALLEASLDESEGADMLMVKPALCYLDIVSKIKQESLLPLVAYHVSGEYAMLKSAAQNNYLDEIPAVREVLTSIRRAGANLIVTYYAKFAAQNLF